MNIPPLLRAKEIKVRDYLFANHFKKQSVSCIFQITCLMRIPQWRWQQRKYAHMNTHAHKKRSVGYQPATLLLSNKGDVWKYAARRFWESVTSGERWLPLQVQSSAVQFFIPVTVPSVSTSENRYEQISEFYYHFSLNHCWDLSGLH